jgi:hypothetical protein
MYLKRLFIVLIITCSVAYATGMLFDHVYKKRWSTLFFEKTDALMKDSSDYDIIYLGNSRVHFGINPYYVDSVTGLSSFNFANGGADALDIMLTSSVYLQHHPAPKMVIISLDMGALTINESLKSCFHYLFYLENDSINKYMKQAGFLTTMMKIFPFTKYSFFDEYNRTSLFVKGKQYPVFDHNIYKGFLNTQPDTNVREAGLYNIKISPLKLWDTAIIYLRNTVARLQHDGSMVVFVSPPERNPSRYRGTAFRKATDSIFTGIANEYHLNYLHFENTALYRDDYFTDDIHLNEPGTRIYSIQLADSIKGIYPDTKQPPY